MPAELVVLFEHPEWQEPLFEALDERGIRYDALDLKEAAFASGDPPRAPLYFNQASPSAYLRGNARAVPFAAALLGHLEPLDARVVNGVDAFRLERSKSAQLALLRRLDVDHPRSIVFNDPDAVRARADEIPWPALLKPEQGGSGARMRTVADPDELADLLDREPELWRPDNLLLVQEKLAYDEADGIVRMEFLDGELLYAMHVVSNGSFNLCPSEVCNPSDDRGEPEVAFHPFPEVPEQAVRTGRRIVQAAGLDVGAVEYLETPDGRRVFYDVNANSNLRRPIGAAFDLDPFERVVDFLKRELDRVRVGPEATAEARG